MSSVRSRLEAEIFPFVERPLRYTGNELNIAVKPLESVAVHGVLCFPDLYEIGMSHYGSQILYHIVNRNPQWALSRCYHPWGDAEELLRTAGIPLYALEYFTPLAEADWLGFTVQYELQYTNVLNMLDLAGLAVRREERGEESPLVIAGGPCMGNPEPLAPFVDACVIGDGEDVVVEICRLTERSKEQGWTRERRLRALAELEGVYVPGLYPVETKGLFVTPALGGRPVVRAARVGALQDSSYPAKPLVPLGDVVHHRLAVEVMRGCTRGCRFCSAGTYYRPVRERSVESIRNQIEHNVRATGWREAGLLSLSTADYSGIDCLLRTLERMRRTERLALSLPSTRIDALTEGQITALNAVSPASSFTIAPEAGSQRLRDVVNKDFTDRAILDTVSTLLDNNIQTLKLYFMIGLPTETDEDIEAMIALIGAIAGLVRERGRRRTVSVAVSPFGPKSFTPFQWEPIEEVESLLVKAQRIKNALRPWRNVRVSYRDPRMSHLETVMARGDRRVGELVHRAWSKGARFDGWDEHFCWNRWREAAMECGVDMARYTSAIPLDQPLPWSAISTGISRAFLEAERDRARNGVITPDCRRERCSQCGVCGAGLKPRLLGGRESVVAPVEREPEQGRAPARGDDPVQLHYYRIAYAKGEEARFLSHRDTMNLFIRALAAAGIPMAFSQGYHPHPKVAFGPPLATGVMGARELFHCAMARPVDLDSHALAPWLPAGIEVVGIRALPGKPAALETQMVAARYRLAPRRALEASEAESAVARLLEQERVVVVSRKKGRPVDRDIRPLVRELRVVEDDGGVSVAAVLEARPGRTCRPDDLLGALFPGRRFADFAVTRTACLTDERAGRETMLW